VVKTSIPYLSVPPGLFGPPAVSKLPFLKKLVFLAVKQQIIVFFKMVLFDPMRPEFFLLNDGKSNKESSRRQEFSRD